MAEAERGRLKQIQKIQELFHGRFKAYEVRILLEKFDWNSESVVNFVFTSAPSEVREKIGLPVEESEDLLARLEDGRALAGEWSVVGADGRHIGVTVRQFACCNCDISWWRKVPSRKMVSKCRKCRQRYEALARGDEWGWAEFHCSCHKDFWGFCQMITSSQCRNCGTNVFPTRIIPPEKRRRDRSKARVSYHVCNAPDCIASQNVNYSRRRRRLWGNPPGGNNQQPAQARQSTCVHPRNRDGYYNPVVVIPSTSHVSTGSTIDTCLTQNDDVSGASWDDGRLPTVSESDSSDPPPDGNDV